MQVVPPGTPGRGEIIQAKNTGHSQLVHVDSVLGEMDEGLIQQKPLPTLQLYKEVWQTKYVMII